MLSVCSFGFMLWKERLYDLCMVLLSVCVCVVFVVPELKQVFLEKYVCASVYLVIGGFV